MATIKGKWIWADAIESNLEPGYVIEATIPFVSNRESFSGLYIQGFAIPSHVNIQYGGMNGILVTRHQLNENNEVILCKILETYRVMDFGEGGEINDEVYNFIVEHATPYTYTVSEKLEIIAKNEKAVYQSGYDKALEKGGYNEGFEAGKQAEYDAFWDAYIPEKLNWQYVFYSDRWSDSNFYPNKDLIPTGNLTFGFSSNRITDLKQRLIDCNVKLDTSKLSGGNYMFCYCSLLTRLPLISFVGLKENISNTFNNNQKMVEIEKIILKDDGSTTFSHWFDQCAALTTIAFEGVIGNDINFQWSTKLKAASIESIINHLSDTSSGKTLTLSLTAVDNAYGWYMPDGSFAGGSASGHWSSLEASKPNWTINLV